MCLFFFFQAEDGIRDGHVTGVQTCALPISVIEVGVDVANATMVVLLDAERFGISQLHQLRGRIGRGGLPGLCLLVSGSEEIGRASCRERGEMEVGGGYADRRLEERWVVLWS